MATYSAQCYPPQDNCISHMFSYTDIMFEQITYSQDLWINFDTIFNQTPDLDSDVNFTLLLIFLSKNHQIKRLFFYDWFDGSAIRSINLDRLTKLAENYKIIWLTQNQTPPLVPGVDAITSDFLWNRSKSAYFDKRPGWKQSGDINNYSLIDLDFISARSCKYISLSRFMSSRRKELVELLKNYHGYLSYSVDTYLRGNQQSDEKILMGMSVLPAKKYLTDCYICCQVESVDNDYRQILITEKTYDMLIQGLIVINFASPGFYNTLQNLGWQLPIGIDMTWDSIADTEIRFNQYLVCLSRLFDQELDQLHELYVANRSVIEHNRSILITKLYDTAWTQIL